MRELGQLCEARLSISFDALPDLATRDAYDAGVSPECFFEEVVLPRVSEADVSFVDGIACGASEHEDLLGGSDSEEL